MSTHLSIVIVEDNDDLRELTADALRAQGHQVCALPCAEAVDDALSAAPADVFLIDLNLPGEDGLSLARRIRNAQPLVGIIIISARAELTDKVVGYDSGADVYLPKPVPLEELSAALKSFARRRQAPARRAFAAGRAASSRPVWQRQAHPRRRGAAHRLCPGAGRPPGELATR